MMDMYRILIARGQQLLARRRKAAAMVDQLIEEYKEDAEPTTRSGPGPLKKAIRQQRGRILEPAPDNPGFGPKRRTHCDPRPAAAATTVWGRNLRRDRVLRRT